MTPPAALSSLDAALRRLPRPLLLALGLAGVALLAVLDTAGHHTLPLETFYVAPVLAVGWLTRSIRYGLVVAVAAALVRPLERLSVAAPPGVPAPHPALLVAGAATQVLLYLVLLALLSSLRGYLQGREAEALRDELTGIANRRAFLASAAPSSSAAAATAISSRCSTSTSTTSRRPTTVLATRRATACWCASPRCLSQACAQSTHRRASAAMSSRC